MLLFRCETYYQLIIIIHLKTTLLKDVSADLILSDLSDFNLYVDKIKRTSLFRQVFLINDRDIIHDFSRLTEKELFAYSQDPEKYFGKMYDMLKKDYTDVFFGVPRGINILFYNLLVKYGCQNLNVNFFDEGLQSYLNKYLALYNKLNQSFCENIKALYLLKDDLFVGNKPPKCKLISLPPFSDNSFAQNILIDIFGTNDTIFKENFIFFEEASFEDGFYTNDIDILDMVAEIVGKENIIVKLHPRTRYDRFSIRGYKVWNKVKTPIEIFELDGSLDKKIFLSVSSTAVVTNFLLYNNTLPTIYLFPLFNTQTHFLQNNNVKRLFYKIRNIYNSDNTRMVFPTDKEKLSDALIYMEGVASLNE